MSRAMDEWMESGARKERRWALFGSIVGGVALLIGAGVVLFVQCNGVPAGDERVHDALKAQGFHDAKLFGADIGACAQDESSRHFTAQNSSGARVEGTVCCGLTGVAKGCTIRWGR
jgi:hypothetical protein